MPKTKASGRNIVRGAAEFSQERSKLLVRESQRVAVDSPVCLWGWKCFKVLDAFHEKATWKNDGRTVTFYPFLVVLENTRGRSQKVWLPYWHKDGRKLKYGERATWTDARLFCGLFAQAHAKGYFRVPPPKS
jgi:hypothetical protein